MKEKLIIRNFGPIKDVELELGRFNVLIGENGTGKSIVAKVVASIYSFLENTNEGGGTGSINTRNLTTLSYLKKNLAVYKIDRYLTKESVIIFKRDKIFFYLEKGSVSTNIDELRFNDYSVNSTTTYIPADRIATSLFSSATWPALIDVEEGRIDMPKYFLRFINLFERLKKSKDEFDFTEVLGIKFRQDEEGIDEVILANGMAISINESSSAIQSNLSLSVIIEHQADKSEKKTFIIEEPELNLFPATQNKLIQYLVDKTMNYGNSILLTTHSPYILASLNNLMEAFKTANIDIEETNKIIEKKYWINPDDVSAYMMLADGHCEDIFDREEGLIKSEKIDEVSNILNEQFDAFLNLEFSNNEVNT